jgi:hypothetical protein
MSSQPPDKCLAYQMDKLFELVFIHTMPDVNEKVKKNFKTPFQIMHYLQSLVSVVLDSQQPSPAGAHFREHLHSLLFKHKSNLVEHLIDCLEVVVPNEAVAARPGHKDDVVALGVMGTLKLRVEGMACGAVPEGSRRADVVMIESLQLQAQILSLIAGVLRAAWCICVDHAPSSSEHPNCTWHAELGYAPYLLWRFLRSDTAGKPAIRFDDSRSLYARILDNMQHRATGSGGDDMGTLFKILHTKTTSALKLALLSSLDMGWERAECKLQQPQSKVMFSLAVACILTLDTMRGTEPGNDVRNETCTVLECLASRHASSLLPQPLSLGSTSSTGQLEINDASGWPNSGKLSTWDTDVRQRGTQFTCFTGTKVQILTQLPRSRCRSVLVRGV